LLEHVHDVVGESHREAGGNVVEELFYFGDTGGPDQSRWVDYLGVGRVEEFDGFGLKGLFHLGFIKNFLVLGG
jgi:hypothetical protein